MANKAIEINDKLNNIVECCICTEVLTDPRILPCFHTFCVNCLKEIGLKAKKGPGDKMSCPQCRAEFTVPLYGFMGLPKNFFMDKLLEVIRLSSQQNVCDLNTGSCSSVKWYCEECRQKLCDECSKIHKTTKTHKNIDLVPFENHTDTLKSFDIIHPTFCDQHEKKLEIFCNDCHVVLCTFCFLENHQSHKWSKVTEAAEIFRTHMIRNIDMLSSCVTETRSITKKLEENDIKFLETVSKVEPAVNKKKLQVKASLEKIVDEAANSLLLRLTSLTHTASKQNEMEKDEIDRHQTKLDSYIRFCNEIAAKGSDVDVCRAASELDTRAKELKELHGTVMERKPSMFHISFEEKLSEDFLKPCDGNLLGKIEVCSDQVISGNDSDENASLAAKPKLKNAIANIDPNTGQNVLEYLEISSNQTSNEKLYKKIRGILDKLAFSAFEKLMIQIAELPIDNEERLSGFVEIIYEKAISEPMIVKEYSALAQRLMFLSVPSTDDPTLKVTFKKLLLNRCQEEFEKDQQDERDIIQRQKEIEENMPEDQEKRLVEEKEEAVSRSLRRSVGNIRFTGELFKQKMLAEEIMHDCIKKLLDAEDEDSLEILCNLLKTAGKELHTEKAKKLMDSYFVRLGDKQGSVPSRIRFMIKDLLELRRNEWLPMRVENIPKTLLKSTKRQKKKAN